MTAAVRISPPPSATVWALIVTPPVNYAPLAQRPHGVFVSSASTATLSDGVNSITVGPGLHFLSPLSITAITGTVHALFQG